VFRGEVFQDDDGFAVVQTAESDDSLDLHRRRFGGLDPRTVGGGATTYYALTLGANWRPWKNLLLQTEIRYDWSYGRIAPFDDSSGSDRLTIGLATVFTI
jgi:hypothetical protein